MKFYIAARTGQIEIVKEMTKFLVKQGYECAHDWTAAENSNLARPYADNYEKAGELALKDVAGARDAEIFIIIGDRSGTGMYVELGVALATNAKIYAIGEHNDMTIFHFHPNVIRLETFEEVLQDLGI